MLPPAGPRKYSRAHITAVIVLFHTDLNGTWKKNKISAQQLDVVTIIVLTSERQEMSNLDHATALILKEGNITWAAMSSS